MTDKYNDILDTYISLSHLAGKTLADVQGPGGNVSAKFTHDLLWIKPSGYLLQEISEDLIGAEVKYRDLQLDQLSGLNHAETQAEQVLVARTTECTMTQDLRASMETSMHAYIPYRYILHNHNAYVNVFLTSEAGVEVIGSMLDAEGLTAGWIPYVSPGLGLTLAIMQQYPLASEIPKILFLKNHGLVISSDSGDEVRDIYTRVSNMAKSYLNAQGCSDLNIDIVKVSESMIVADVQQDAPLLSLIHEGKLIRHCYPDSVVFGQSLELDPGAVLTGILQLPTSTKHKTIIENLSVINYILQTQQQLGWKTSYLEDNDIQYILDMEQEKYRVALQK